MFAEVSVLIFIRLVIFITLATLISACQSTPSSSIDVNLNVDALYFDDAFPNYHNISIETPEDIFSLDADMLALVENVLKPEQNIKKKGVQVTRSYI